MGIKKTGWPTRIIIGALVVHALWGCAKAQISLYKAEAYRLELKTAVEALSEENEALEAEIAAADDPAVMEQLARTRLGLVRPGEIIFYVDREAPSERE